MTSPSTVQTNPHDIANCHICDVCVVVALYMHIHEPAKILTSRGGLI